MDELDVLGLDGRQLKLFLTVLDEGSVSRAAEHLDLNQSTVSHHLDKLRRAMRDPLFVKLGKGITPTDYAVSVAPRVRELVASLEGLGAEITHDAANDTRPITLASNTAECRPLLKRVSAELARQAKNAPKRFLELGARSRIEPLLETGEADLVLTIRPDQYPASVKAVQFSSDSFMCFYDPQVRAAPDSLQTYCAAPHAALDFGGSSKSTIAQALERAGFSRTIALAAPDVSALADLMRGTEMIATFQSELADSVFSGFASCPVPMALPKVHHDLVWHRRQDAAPRNTWLRELLLACRT